MSAPILICPYDRGLLDRLSGRTLCLRVADTAEIAPAADAARARNDLFRIIHDAAVPLAEIRGDEAWRGIPLTLSVPGMGKFRDLAKSIGLFRALRLDVHLPYNDRNLTDARVLASLGIPTCVVLNADVRPDWDALADFMTYALLGPAPHAPIEPFQTIRNSYRRDARCRGWGEAYFDDPSRYLHLDAAGNIALSHRELQAGVFLADDLRGLDKPEVAQAARDRVEAWRSFFLADHFCAKCPGWKLCHGRFSEGKMGPDGCVDFFREMEDVIAQSLNGTRRP